MMGIFSRIFKNHLRLKQFEKELELEQQRLSKIGKVYEFNRCQIDKEELKREFNNLPYQFDIY